MNNNRTRSSSMKGTTLPKSILNGESLIQAGLHTSRWQMHKNWTQYGRLCDREISRGRVSWHVFSHSRRLRYEVAEVGEQSLALCSTMPNQALHLTAYSVRSSLAPASGSG